MLVQQERLLTLFDLPLSLPQTHLTPASWTAIATVQLASGATLDLRWLQLHVSAYENSDTSDPCGTSGQSTINPDFPAGSLATVFLIKDWAPATEPWSQTVVDQLSAPTNYASAPTAVPPIIAVRPVTPLQLSEAGTYTLVVLNNTTNRNLTVSVSGAVTVDSDPL